ncbi:integral membrane protein [Pyrenophora tritici-repentis]|uniref:Rhodopsin domain-containing protein n=2 Tax=Pyrenophora tritici-repentis TaxID=45151 RepID=A0A2W1EGY1_9PLEO|nr:uncharacterized protein PTRG_08733 [Pyrenophora tritici-repentis Pt-1C-BFP]KAA8627302.1 hypothetical protein PtrV1_02982 [Pyrenophora tritici-repentis]EDU41784.1 conserved hypothetical protein [Pyrenophora tritici-repentis Pt-1C-BFP]KAF7442673.1 hypothetical protein A1F99_135420 [Pyrenophora tritici-repentis]KAF7578948.1 hypothetical protein PtrM4_031880 [Pyrenophora tritici-repentis]KAI0583090.1 hypothetical protein Alg215_03750 [Pyrenophora tritici-repentis]
MAPNVGLGTQGPVARGWGIWLTSVIAVIVAGLFVGARFAQRFVKKSGLGVDDYMIIAALLSSIILTVTECQAVVYGYGRPWKTLPMETRLTARKWFYGANIIYKIVLMFNKVSVVCLYYRIFAVTTSSFRIACHIMNTWIVVTGLSFAIATVFQCTPIAAFWDHSIKGAKCFKNEPWWISYATVQISTDFMLLAMPARQIMKLSMGKAEKLGIALVFGTGGFVTFASIYRATTIARSASNPDPTLGPVPATIWSVIEANAGIVCACLPMLRAPFLRLFGPLFTSRVGSKASTNRRSYPADWKSDHHLEPVESTNKSSASQFQPGSERGSEDEIITERRLQPQGPSAIHRRGSDMFIKKEFSIERSVSQRMETEPKQVNQDEVSATTRANQNKSDDSSASYHV